MKKIKYSIDNIYTMDFDLENPLVFIIFICVCAIAIAIALDVAEFAGIIAVIIIILVIVNYYSGPGDTRF
jgi:hypothetical protein